MPEAFILDKMTWPELEQALEEVELAVIPVGSTEQHGPNTTFDTDTVRARGFSRLLAERMHPKVIVTPAVTVGLSLHHMNFPGSMTLRAGTLLEVLFDMAWSVKQHGIEKVLYLNGHGGNRPVLDITCTRVQHELDMLVGWTGTMDDIVADVMAENVESETYGHACEAETAQLYYVDSDPEHRSIRDDALEDSDIQLPDWRERLINMPYTFDEVTRKGNLGDARQYSEELGEKMTEKGLDRVVAAIAEQFGVEC
jgi:creatinine amidohydrolase